MGNELNQFSKDMILALMPRSRPRTATKAKAKDTALDAKASHKNSAHGPCPLRGSSSPFVGL